MKLFDPSLRWFIALVTFERKMDDSEILGFTEQGACGWMGARVKTEGELGNALEGELSEVGLALVEIDDVIEVRSIDEVECRDQHLASNMQTWQPGKCTVWGTIHTYLADGEV